MKGTEHFSFVYYGEKKKKAFLFLKWGLCPISSYYWINNVYFPFQSNGSQNLMHIKIAKCIFFLFKQVPGSHQRLQQICKGTRNNLKLVSDLSDFNINWSMNACLRNIALWRELSLKSCLLKKKKHLSPGTDFLKCIHLFWGFHLEQK